MSGVLLALYAGAMAETLQREGSERLGHFAATVLARNAVYGVLTADRPLLQQFAEGTTAAAGPDVVGVVIRDLKKEVLAQAGSTGEPPLAQPSATDTRRGQKVLSGRGEELVLFSAPVMVGAESKKGQVDLVMRTTPARLAATTVDARMLAVTIFLSVATVLSGRLLAGREG